MPDTYSAIWVSHSSLSDFRNCPRSYFLKNVYKDPNTGHKIQLMAPALALGQAVHTVLERLSSKSVEQRFKTSLVQEFSEVFARFSGEKGGFANAQEEERFRNRGEKMVRQVVTHPGPLATLAIKIQTDLPRFWLSEADGIILCGKIDWLEYIPNVDGVRIIDFKTGSGKEDPRSLQLSIYHLLVHRIQKRRVVGAQYWYLEQSSEPEDRILPPLQEAEEQVLAEAKKVVLARKLEHYPCPKGADGCHYCLPYEQILAGEAKLIGLNNRKDVYVLSNVSQDMDFEAELL